MNALNGAAVNRLLDLFLRGAGRVMHFGDILIVQTKDLRTDFHAKPAGNAFGLVYGRDSAHVFSPFKELETA
jgi:hypothetical protein